MKLLVVVDMQNDFVSGVLGTKEAAAIVPNVVKKVAEAAVSVDAACRAGVTPESHQTALAAMGACQTQMRGI